MLKTRIYSLLSREACLLLGQQIKLLRKERRFSEEELASRAGISRRTLQKIEKGSPTCAIGLVFEVAALVGIKLFDDASLSPTRHLRQVEDKIALLPKKIHTSRRVDDDF